MRLILFDIDGTLLLSGGAGTRALNRSFQTLYDLDDGMEEIQVGGRTDPDIVREVLDRKGLQLDSAAELLSTYLGFLEEEIQASEGFRVLPGARELVQDLAQDSRFLVGVATGNVQEGARMKLDRAGLSSYFAFGGYGSDAEDRTELIQIAARRGAELIAPLAPEIAARRGAELIAPLAPEEVFVIGDTPRDISHGGRAGAKTIAVATGSFSVEALSSHDPDLVVPGLTPAGPILDFLTS